MKKFKIFSSMQNIPYFSYNKEIEKNLKFLTKAGHLVQSEGERIIADRLYECGIDYVYDSLIEIDGEWIRPDFILPGLNDLIIEYKGWTTFGSPGSGVDQFFKGKGLGIDSKDRIYIIDAGNHRIIRIDDMTGKGWITYGTKGSEVGQFEIELNGLSFDAQERIYISDEHNDRIVRIDDLTGKGWVEFGGLPNDKIGQPHDVSITKTGHIYILDTTNRRIVRIDDMTGKGWIAFAPDAKTEDARYFHKWHMSAPHGMFVVERSK